MYDSSSDQDITNINTRNNLNYLQGDSMNDTAASFMKQNNSFYVQDNDNYAQQTLKSFYQQYLKIDVDMRFQQLQKDQKVFKNGVIAVYPPEPLVYFLPYTILIDNKQNLNQIRDNIKRKYQERIDSKNAQINILFPDTKQRDQLNVTIRTIGELVYYRIKKVSINSKYHQFIDCLDKDILVDRLFHFYKITYEKFYFQQISILFMYWAYLRKFLNEQYLSPSAIKILIICLFINFGCGIKKILPSYAKKFWEKQKKCMQMSKCNRKGQCVIDQDILKYRNYSIQQKKGFYMVTQKKYQIIRQIVPIYFPIGQRKADKPYKFQYRKQQKNYFKQQAQKIFKRNQQQQNDSLKITRYNLLMMLFASMNDYFNYSNKIILDLKRPEIFYQEHSDQFLLQIHHPVFNRVISRALVQTGSAARRIQGELKKIIQNFKDNQQAIQNVRFIFQKK